MNQSMLVNLINGEREDLKSLDEICGIPERDIFKAGGAITV